ncbi:MAG TPA: polyamine ABC transporter ATP-binding protein, partial [Firmicutes bacterium]|nr:polyamine ABC transporter ATP-binding protein [Bacillota bacterium]
VLLLDEPLSNLDPKLREIMRFEIKDLQKKLGLTIVYVTHDQAEAMALSDRMLVMDMGVVQQVDTPTSMYNNPANRFVFSFLGLSNFVPVAVHDGTVWPAGAYGGSLECEIPPDWDDDRAVLAFRPNEIEFASDGGYRTRIKNRVFLGDYVEYRMDIGDTEIRIQTHEHKDFGAGDLCGVRLSKVKWYPAEEEVSDDERERRKVI